MAQIVQDRPKPNLVQRVAMDAAIRTLSRAGWVRLADDLVTDGQPDKPVFWMSSWKAVVGPTWVTFLDVEPFNVTPIREMKSVRTADEDDVAALADSIANL